MQFRKGDGRSRAASWTIRAAASLARYAEKTGLEVSGPTYPGAWGSVYLSVECPDGGCSYCWGNQPHRTNIRGEEYAEPEILEIRIANHAEGSGFENGHPSPDLNLHNEIDGAEALKHGKAAIAAFAARHGLP